MSAAALDLLPAVDVAGGRATQVVHGTDEPYAVALGWVRQGAGWVHLVDLDRAFRRGDNAALVAHLVSRLPVPVQLSGGIDDEESLRAALGTGARRVNLASTALQRPDWLAGVVADHGDRVVVGVDVRHREVVARGSGVRIGPLEEVLTALRSLGVQHVLVADASRDGTRHGVDVDLFRFVAERVEGDVTASGGVGSLADLRALRALAATVPAQACAASAQERGALTGVVLGSALYHGAFTLGEALEAVR